MMKTEATTDRRDEVALFRYGLIADLTHMEPGEPGTYARLKEKAKHRYAIPGSHRTGVAAETMRGWLRAWRKGGFDALRPKPRADQGQARAIPQEVTDLLCTIKEDKHELSVRMVIEAARASGEVPGEMELAPATVHRLLSRQGLMAKRPEEPTSKDRRHFAFDKANELWMSDVMHAVPVTVESQRRYKTYLIAFLDDATRVVPFSAFALSENTAAFLPVLEQAIRRRGLPKRLYVDNGAVYRSHHLELVCAKLGITLIHSRPYVPQGRGKIERFFRTVRMQFLPLLSPEDTASLEALNRRLWAFIEGEYHHRPHKGLGGETPLDRWAQICDEVRLPEPGLDLAELFLFEEKRKVARDRTVSLRGALYEVDAILVGQTVTLRFDPTRPERKIEVWHVGRKVGAAKPVDAYANCFVKRDHATKSLSPSRAPEAPPEGLRLRDFDGDNSKGGH
ncbi:MAG: DDE-type integrase/transposase/recombinase [Acidobacteriaceae bacterium]|jgi:transposase InsO family protein